MYGTARATQRGYSLWELQVFGYDNGGAPPPSFRGDTAAIPPAA
jgi:hypothetical protein